MKKIAFILIVILFSNAITKAQETDTVFNDYFLSPYNCGDLNFKNNTWDNYDSNGIFYYYLVQNHYRFELIGGGLYWWTNRLDRAQPCYTDTILTIKGVSIGVCPKFYNIEGEKKLPLIVYLNDVYGSMIECVLDTLQSHYQNFDKGKLKIMNDSLNREIASVNIDTNFNFINTPYYSYIEYSFDSLVNVNGLFYIVEDVTSTSTQINDVVFTRCRTGQPSLTRHADGEDSTNPWLEWENHPVIQNQSPFPGMLNYCYIDHTDGTHPYAIPSDCQMFMFPIFAETDTTLGNGTDSGADMSLYNATVDRYSNVYPNPANDIVTVQSSFKVKEIEIHNALGQVVLRKEGSQNIETIDVSNLQSGAYIVRIKTQRGFANKKILIE